MSKQRRVEILSSLNQEHGFYGSIAEEWGRRNTAQAWTTAFNTIAAISDWDSEIIREFLDSGMGRRLADSLSGISSLADLPAAISGSKGREYLCRFAALVRQRNGKGYKKAA